MKIIIKRFYLLLCMALTLNYLIPFLFPMINGTAIAEAATVKLNKTKIVIKVGETYQLELKGAKSVIVWTSSKKSIATVSSNGLVKGVKSGNIIVSAKVGNKIYKCVVTVMYPTLNKSNIETGVGDTLQLEVKNLPLTCEMSDIMYKSDNADVVMVDDKGLITAKSEGYANIIVSFKSYNLRCGVLVKFTDKNKEDAINALGIEYAEINNQIVCIIKNNSKVNLTFDYDLAFYDSSDNLISISGVTGIMDGFFANDEKVLYFNTSDKVYSYYKIRFSNIWGHYNYLNVKDKVDITASEAYDYTYKYTENISGYPISKTETVKVIDLDVNNRSENRVMLEAYVVYYKNNRIVNIENFSKWIGKIDVGITVIKNPITTGIIRGKIASTEYDNYKIIYTARTLKY